MNGSTWAGRFSDNLLDRLGLENSVEGIERQIHQLDLRNQDIDNDSIRLQSKQNATIIEARKKIVTEIDNRLSDESNTETDAVLYRKYRDELNAAVAQYNRTGNDYDSVVRARENFYKFRDGDPYSTDIDAKLGARGRYYNSNRHKNSTIDMASREAAYNSNSPVENWNALKQVVDDAKATERKNLAHLADANFEREANNRQKEELERRKARAQADIDANKRKGK